MKHHEISKEEVEDFMLTAEIVIASSSREEKRLCGNLRGSFAVYYKGERKYATNSMANAISSYNSITV